MDWRVKQFDSYINIFVKELTVNLLNKPKSRQFFKQYNLIFNRSNQLRFVKKKQANDCTKEKKLEFDQTVLLNIPK